MFWCRLAFDCLKRTKAPDDDSIISHESESDGLKFKSLRLLEGKNQNASKKRLQGVSVCFCSGETPKTPMDRSIGTTKNKHLTLWLNNKLIFIVNFL